METLNRLIAYEVIFFMLLFNFNSSAQSVGINATESAPHPSALLDLSATDKGFLITRADTLNIVSPAFGLMTLAPLDSCLYIFSGIEWLGMGGGGSDCSCNCASSSPPFKCGDPYTDERDNEIYGTVLIGKQCWMSENLNYTPNPGNSWCYDDDISNCNIFGRLYDWNTAMNNVPSSSNNPSGVQGVCPTGWHLSSDSEWKEMEMHLGMSQVDADAQGWRGTNEGDALKSTSMGGNNSSGFTALHGGYRYSNGVYSHKGSYGSWWTATESSSTFGWRRALGDSHSDVSHVTLNKGTGFSVRCLKD